MQQKYRQLLPNDALYIAHGQINSLLSAVSPYPGGPPTPINGISGNLVPRFAPEFCKIVYSCNNKSAFRSTAVFFRFLLVDALADEGGRLTHLMAYCMEEDLEFGGSSNSWTEPQAPLPRSRPIVHGLLALPIVWPCGEDDIILYSVALFAVIITELVDGRLRSPLG